MIKKKSFFCFLTENVNRLSLLMFLIYFIVNVLFLTKYGIRQTIIPLSILLVFFSGANFSFFLLRNNAFLLNKINRKLIFLSIILISILYFGLCFVLKDPYNMNIDRWQTLNFSLDYWMKGKYIYDIPNFMGNLSSYLPGQLLIALLFYLLGNVGFLQVAVFIFFSYAVLKTFKNNFVAFQAIFLFGVSLSYVYEVVCKSDFISSFVIIASFMILWDQKFKKNYFSKPILLGFLIGILCLTRSVVVIPIILFLLKPFIKAILSDKIKFCLSFLATLSFLLATVLLPAKNLHYIFEYNPLNLQGQSNRFMMIVFVLLSIVISFFVKNIKQVFFFSTLLVFLVMSSFLLEQYWVLGHDYQNNFFATTYLASCLPFSIVSYCMFLKTENSKIIKL